MAVLACGAKGAWTYDRANRAEGAAQDVHAVASRAHGICGVLEIRLQGIAVRPRSLPHRSLLGRRCAGHDVHKRLASAPRNCRVAAGRALSGAEVLHGAGRRGDSLVRRPCAGEARRLLRPIRHGLLFLRRQHRRMDRPHRHAGASHGKGVRRGRPSCQDHRLRDRDVRRPGRRSPSPRRH